MQFDFANSGYHISYTDFTNRNYDFDKTILKISPAISTRHP